MKSKLAVMFALGCGMACGRDEITTVTDGVGFPLAISPPTRQLIVGDSADYTLQFPTEAPGTTVSCVISNSEIASVRVVPSACRVVAKQAGQAYVTGRVATGQASAAVVVVNP